MCTIPHKSEVRKPRLLSSCEDRRKVNVSFPHGPDGTEDRPDAFHSRSRLGVGLGNPLDVLDVPQHEPPGRKIGFFTRPNASLP